MSTLTTNEKELLIAIRDNEFHDGNHPVDNPIWVDCIDGWSGERKFPGTMAALVKRGFARTDGTSCQITEFGFEAIQAAGKAQ